MGRYIVRFTGNKEPSDEHIRKVQTRPDVNVVDSSKKMMLIETTPEVADSLSKTLPDCVVTPEQTIPLPDPRPKLRQS
jgi:hypothetical protein